MADTSEISYQPHQHDPPNGGSYARSCCLAAVLRHVADRLDTVDEQYQLSFTLGIQPSHDGGDDAVIAAVNAVGVAVFGRPGEARAMPGGQYHHQVEGRFERHATDVAAYGSVQSPEERAARQEVERLRAEVEDLRRQRAVEATADD